MTLMGSEEVALVTILAVGMVVVGGVLVLIDLARTPPRRPRRIAVGLFAIGLVLAPATLVGRFYYLMSHTS